MRFRTLMLLVGFFLTVFVWLGIGGPRSHTQACSVTVQPGQAIQPVINQASVGAVICLNPGTWEETLVIDKGLTLRGAGPDQTLIKGVTVDSSALTVRSFSNAMVTIEGLRVTQSSSIPNFAQGGGIDVVTKGIVVIRNVQIVKTGRDGLRVGGIGTIVNLIDSLVFSSGDGGLLNREGGIRVGGFAQLTLTNSRVLENAHYGIGALDFAAVKLIGSQVSRNGGGGLIVMDRVTVELENSSVSANEFFGLFAADLARVKVRESAIEGNGVGFRCDMIEQICNGLLIQDNAVLALLDSTILNNMDWGLAVVRKECRYAEDRFTGQVIFEGENTITGNNKSGNHTAAGNPGKHPFTDLPPGNVCLP